MFTPFKTIVRNLAKIATGLVFGVSVMSAANAQVPKPINPMSFASLPYEQRLAHIKAKNAMLLNHVILNLKYYIFLIKKKHIVIYLLTLSINRCLHQ